MQFARRYRLQWILLLSVTLLFTRIADSHLHLCFDGGEPPVSLHTLDGDAHHDAEDTTHNDQDIELPGATLAKVFSYLADAVLLFTCLTCLIVLLIPQRAPLCFYRCLFTQSNLRLLRPPLRGPPLLLPR